MEKVIIRIRLSMILHYIDLKLKNACMYMKNAISLIDSYNTRNFSHKFPTRAGLQVSGHTKAIFSIVGDMVQAWPIPSTNLLN